MPLRRERIPVAAPIKGGGSSWLTQYEEMKGAVRMRNYSDKTLEAYRYWIGKFQAFVRSKPPDHLNTEDVKGLKFPRFDGQRRRRYPSGFHLIHSDTHFASHLLLANYDIQTIQKLLGHGDVRTTMIYLQSAECNAQGARWISQDERAGKNDSSGIC